MKKILFFPLLRIPSGHHQVADSLIGYFGKRDSEIICKKVELLSTWNPLVESIVTKTYLEWIHHSPKTYAWIYKQMAHTSKPQRTYKYYELLFMKKMKEILYVEKPDLIICTHGFPSYLLSKLKQQRQCMTPVINVYTDFFINDVWGKTEIDFHFVPHQKVKDDLIQRNGILEQQIIVTGIPIAEQFNRKPRRNVNSNKYKILISGGSIGLGNISELLQQQKDDGNIEYYVACGKNKKLYEQLVNLQSKYIYPLPYISSKEEMNDLYNMVDAIVTKPGGVTVSEALQKALPIFIHSALPGQEEINLQLLIDLKLVHKLTKPEALAEQITRFFQNEEVIKDFYHSLETYLSAVEVGDPNDIFHLINSLINHKEGVIAL